MLGHTTVSEHRPSAAKSRITSGSRSHLGLAQASISDQGGAATAAEASEGGARGGIGPPLSNTLSMAYHQMSKAGCNGSSQAMSKSEEARKRTR